MDQDIMFKSDPQKLEIEKDVVKDSFGGYNLRNIHILVNSNNILYLIYSKEDKSIISYDLTKSTIVNETKNAHEKFITNFRYQKIADKDIIMSISCEDNNIKLWNFPTWECILNIKNVNSSGILKSSSFLKENSQYYIVTSSSTIPYLNQNQQLEGIKVYDMQGNKVKEIPDSKDDTYFLDVYYDEINKKNFVITANIGSVKSYDYTEGKLFQLYKDTEGQHHYSIIKHKENNILKLIGSSYDGNVRIWNFASGELLKKIHVYDDYVYDICLWNNKYLFAGCLKSQIRLIDLEEGKVVKTFKANKAFTLTINKFVTPELGECLISQSTDEMKLWKVKL